MKIRAGYKITFDCIQPMPIALMLSVHPDRQTDLITPDSLSTSTSAVVSRERDVFGNIITRVHAPAGPTTFSSLFDIVDAGVPDVQNPGAGQIPVEALPVQTLPFLLGSRYCETDVLSNLAWSLFGGTPMDFPL